MFSKMSETKSSLGLFCAVFNLHLWSFYSPNNGPCKVFSLLTFLLMVALLLVCIAIIGTRSKGLKLVCYSTSIFVRYMTNKGMERLRAENFLKDLFPGTGNSQKSARDSSANFNDFHHGCYLFLTVKLNLNHKRTN